MVEVGTSQTARLLHGEARTLSAYLESVPWAREVLIYSFDFEILPQPYASPRIHTTDGEPCVVVAENATGGQYFLAPATPNSGPRLWLFADPACGLCPVATTARELLMLVVCCPYWQELTLDTAMDWEQLLDQARALETALLEDMPAFLEARDELLNSLGLSESAPLRGFFELQRSLILPELTASDGWSFTPYFRRLG